MEHAFFGNTKEGLKVALTAKASAAANFLQSNGRVACVKQIFCRFSGSGLTGEEKIHISFKAVTATNMGFYTNFFVKSSETYLQVPFGTKQIRFLTSDAGISMYLLPFSDEDISGSTLA